MNIEEWEVKDEGGRLEGEKAFGMRLSKRRTHRGRHAQNRDFKLQAGAQISKGKETCQPNDGIFDTADT